MLTALEARGFRNLAPLALTLSPGAHLLLGDNGAGKTSVLEAAYLLATTRSFRTRTLADCRQHGADSFRLAAEVVSDARQRLEVRFEAGRLARTVNGRAGPLRDHLAVQAVVAWSAGDGQLWAGAAAERRRFVDRGLVAARPADIVVLARYREVLDRKRALLADDRAAGRTGRVELAAWNQLLAPAAVAVSERRAAWIAAVQAELDALLTALDLDLARPQLRLRASPPACADESAVLTALSAAADEELRRRQPCIGPQRDDLEVLWEGRRARSEASAGERKALGLLLAAAQARCCRALGRPALVLLDDVDAELDRQRLGRLWRAFAAEPQVIASSSRPEVGKELSGVTVTGLVDGRVVTS